MSLRLIVSSKSPEGIGVRSSEGVVFASRIVASSLLAAFHKSCPRLNDDHREADRHSKRIAERQAIASVCVAVADNGLPAEENSIVRDHGKAHPSVTDVERAISVPLHNRAKLSYISVNINQIVRASPTAALLKSVAPEGGQIW